MDKLQKYKEALELIAEIGCMQSAEDEEFFCKKDGSKHSIYCPAGIAKKVLQQSNAADAEAMNDDKYDELYASVNAMLARLGADGTISARSDEVDRVMAAMYAIDGGSAPPYDTKGE